MAISRLNLVSINFDKYRYNEVLLKLFSHDDFHPELASKFIDSVTGLSVYNQDNLYEEILVRLNDASNKYHFKLEEVPVETNQINVLRVKEYLDDLLLDVERIDAVKVQLDRKIRKQSFSYNMLLILMLILMICLAVNIFRLDLEKFQ